MSKVQSASQYIKKNLVFDGETAIILGSGLGDFTDLMRERKTLKYSEIPYYPESNVEGHKGELHSGVIGGKEILVAQGRVHAYEGCSIEKITFSIKVFKRCGIRNIIITNSAGSMRKEFAPGTIVLIAGHLDCTFQEKFENPILVNSQRFYSKELSMLVKKIASELDINLPSGNYCWTLGPAYETPAEINYFRSLSGTAVGMSTLPEILESGKLDLNILTLSVLTNFAAGLSKRPLTHEEVLENAMKSKADFIRILSNLINRI